MNTGLIMKQAHVRRLVATLALLLLTAVAPFAGIGASAQSSDALATRVRFVHASTGTGQVEVHINGGGVLEEFSYGDVSDWVDIDPGSVRVTITADRAGINYSLFDANYPAPAGNDYYVVITDALVVAGTFDTSAISADNGRVQVVHASADTPAVNMLIGGTDQTIAATYPKTSDPIELPAGSYDLDLQLQETGDSLATLPGFTVEAGTSYVLVVMGNPTSEDKPVEIMVLDDPATAPTASPVATPVS
jgi:hypothetical protein